MYQAFKRLPFVSSVVLGISCLDAIAGPAINQFEVKDLQSGPGDFEFQSQNAFSTGQPRRRISNNGELLFDDNTVIRQREAQEIQMGITDYFRLRVGIEFEQELLDDPTTIADANALGSLRLEELAFEAVVVFVKPKAEGVGLGLLLEYGRTVSGEVESPDEFFWGPIIEAHTGPWSFIGNFAFVNFFGGKALPGNDEFVRDRKTDFSYFMQGKYIFNDAWALAAESYGSFDRLGNSGTRSEASREFGDFDQHRIGPIAYYTFYPAGRSRSSTAAFSSEDDDGDKELSVTVGAGPLFGLNQNTPDVTYKLSIEVDY